MVTEEDRARAAEIARRPDLSEIVAEVSALSNVPPEVILGPSRRRPESRARHLVMFIARRAGLTLTEIGRAMGRDHTSVLHGIRAEERRRRNHG